MEQRNRIIGNDPAQLADQAFADYEFGDGVCVSDTSGWEYASHSNQRSRKVYVETSQQRTPSIKLTFTVRFNAANGALVEAYARDEKGQIWGAMPQPKAAAVPTSRQFQIEGIRFSAVRTLFPIPHWLLRTDENGVVFESGAGGISNESVPKMQTSLEYLLSRVSKGDVQDFRRRMGLPAVAVTPAPALRTYEVTAAGFDASTDATDDRVLWVQADSSSTVESAIAGTGAVLHDTIDVDTDIDFILPVNRDDLRQRLTSFAAQPAFTAK